MPPKCAQVEIMGLVSSYKRVLFCHNRTSGCQLPLSSVENRNCCKRRHPKV